MTNVACVIFCRVHKYTGQLGKYIIPKDFIQLGLVCIEQKVFFSEIKHKISRILQYLN